jgi:hypothetical protein
VIDVDRQAVKKRSGGQCEAEVQIFGLRGRCPNQAVEIHHRLTKGRGGRDLDRVKGEIYHLIHLCKMHHKRADGQQAYDEDMLIRGHVMWDKLKNRPVYSGPDKYLTKKYPA